jgi:thiol-disulfide isomerase/thioredoxin
MGCKNTPQRSLMATTATNFDGIDMKDTVEDPAYVAAAEVIIAENASSIVGQPAPLAIITTIDGKTIDLGGIYGHKPVYIKFWATWCVPCRQQMPAFEKGFEQFGDKIQLIALNIGLSDDESSVRAMREKYRLKMPIVIDDGQLASLFHLRVTPQHVVIGKEGRFSYVGHADDKRLSDAIDHVIAAKGIVPNDSVTVKRRIRPLTIGDTVQETTAIGIGGIAVRIGGVRPGRIQVVQFFSSWCEWYLEKTRPSTSRACARRRQELEKIVGKYTNVDWLGIAGGPWATMQDLLDYQKLHGVSLPLALDRAGELFSSFGIHSIPTIVMIADGRIVKVLTEHDTTDIASAIESVSKLLLPSPPHRDAN